MVRALVESGETPEKLWASMVALDWPALTIPDEHGGIGLSIVETAVVVEELGRSLAPGPFLPTVTQFAPMVREAGNAEQRARFLSEVASGSITGTVALAEHARGWGLGDVHMSAERTGDGWVLDGAKFGVMAPDDVDEIVVVASANDGFGAFVVPASDVTVTPVHSLDASRPLSTVRLDRVAVRGDRALGEPGSQDSAHAIRRALEEATLAVALETVGAVDALFQMVLAYVKERQQFGVVVGSFQAMKHKMSDMFIAIERARALSYYAVAAVEEDGDRRTAAVAMAKAASDECQHLVCQESIQSFGGIGFTWEHDCHLFVKRAASNAVLFGGSAEHSLTVAQSIGVSGS
jgi:alkylation response protein AidB-like acyl-CoA dehydrogenase